MSRESIIVAMCLACFLGCDLRVEDPVGHALTMLEGERATFATGKWLVRLCEFPDDERVQPVILEHAGDERLMVRQWALILLIRQWPEDAQTDAHVREAAFDQRFPISLREDLLAEARALQSDWWGDAADLLDQQARTMGRWLTRVQP